MREVPKHPFHQIALLVQRFVVVAEDRPIRSRGDYHQGPSLLNRFDQLIRIIALVGQHGVGMEPFQQGLACVLSYRSPPVTMNRSGLPNASHTACSFVVNPPRQRPTACVCCPLLRPLRVDGRE